MTSAASPISRLAALPEDERKAFMASLSPTQAQELLWDWKVWARPNQLPPEGKWLTWVVLAGRGFGKLLDHDTKIPTPSGWTTMGDVQVGDELFDEAGRVCRVTAKYSPPIEQAYRVTFSDGSTLIADAGHQWVTWTHAERKAFLRSPYEDTARFPENWPQWRLRRQMGRQLPRETVELALAMSRDGVSAREIERAIGVCRASIARHIRAGKFIERADPVVYPDSPGPQIRTTEDIRNTLTYGKRDDCNHSIPNCGPLELPDADLPIPPYTLGAWLGDGSTAAGTMTCHHDDAPYTRAAIESEGFVTTHSFSAKQQSFGIIGLLPLLKQHLGVNTKVVPPIYLRASARQRLALLRGLMDTDGNIEGGSTVAFVNTNKNLIDAVQEIVHSLGMKTTIWSGIGRCNGEDKKRFWRVIFTPTINPFYLPRKARRLKIGKAQSLRNHHRMLVSIDPVDPRPMSCITVDSRNSMYLVGEGMIPTHNTRCGSEWVRSIATGETPLAPSSHRRIAIVAETAADARDVLVEGDSGILSVHPREFRPLYEPSKRRLTWPNGTVATLYNAVEPDQLRGPQHDAAFLDELAKWRYARETWDQLQFGLRLGINPRQIITTTPRPIDVLREIMKAPNTVVTRGSTFDNKDNLAPSFIHNVISKYEGTRLGRQELNAEMLDDVPGALWDRKNIDDNRVKTHPDLKRVIVAIDPSGTRGESDDGDSVGIIVAGLGEDGRAYVLADRTCKLSPDGWGRVAVAAYHEFQADRIVAERNFGGAMVEHVIRTIDPRASYKEVTASRGKVARAEPVAALYEQSRVSHVGAFHGLEDQMVLIGPDGFIGDGSPDRVDALVWAISELMLGHVHHNARQVQINFMGR